MVSILMSDRRKRNRKDAISNGDEKLERKAREEKSRTNRQMETTARNRGVRGSRQVASPKLTEPLTAELALAFMLHDGA